MVFIHIALIIGINFQQEVIQHDKIYLCNNIIISWWNVLTFTSKLYRNCISKSPHYKIILSTTTFVFIF